MIPSSNASYKSRIEERKQFMNRNHKLCIQIMKASRATESSMPSLSHRDFEGNAIGHGAFKSYADLA